MKLGAALVLVTACAWPALGWAQAPPARPAPGASAPGPSRPADSKAADGKKSSDAKQPVTVDSDRMERFGKESLIIFPGNVVARHDNSV